MYRYFYKDNKRYFITFTFAVMLSSVLYISISPALGRLADLLLAGNSYGLFNAVVRFLVAVFLTILGYIFWSLMQIVYFSRMSKVIELDLSKKMMAKTPNISEVTNIFNNEIRTVYQQYHYNAFEILRASVGFVIAIFLGVRMSWQITLFIVACSGVTVLVSRFFAKRVAANETVAQKAKTDMNRMAQGIFSASNTINIFSAQQVAQDKLEKSFENKRATHVRNLLYRSTFVNFMINQPISHFSYYGLLIMTYFWVYTGRLSIGEAIIFQTISHYLSSPLYIMIPCINSMDSTKELRQKFEAILAEPDEVAGDAIVAGDIVLQDVSFSYTDSPFMDKLNLKLREGKRYLIVGESGSGKSTLLKLILKEHKPTSGAIMYSGHDMANVASSTWYKSVAYAGQNVELIPGTFRENIVLGSEYDESKFTRIVSMLNLSYLAEKYNTELDENFSNFSGGELQRVAIARMLYKNSPVFIFDEFSSALDNMNALRVEKELLEIADKLLISVTHRIQPSLIDGYEKIIIMEKGNIKHIGRPSELTHELKGFMVSATNT